MKERSQHWRPVKQPLSLCTRKGWAWGRRCLISPRGTVFEIRRGLGGLLARRRRDFQLEAEV